MPDPLVVPSRGRVRSSPRPGWWARAWLRSCEELALDPDDQGAGLVLARSGRFGAVVVIAGMASAVLGDQRDGEALVVQVKVSPLDDRQWAVVAAELAGRSGNVADLEAGRLPDALVEGTDGLGVELLPGAADIETACACRAWAQPCVHAQGVAVLLAWAMDEDPWVLLLLRGRTREALLEAVADRLDTTVRDPVDEAAERARRILEVADEAPAGHGLADSAVAAYDERVARLVSWSPGRGISR